MPFLGRARKAARLVKRPLLLMQAILERLPFRPAEIALLFVVRCDPLPDVTPGSAIAEIGMAGPEDVEGLSLCADKGWKFRKRFQQGDYCIKAEVGERVAGYLWFSTGGSHAEELHGYEIEIPHGAVYCYDEYVSPEYRKNGIFKQLYRELTDWMRGNGRESILSIIASGNELSWKIHMDMGFRPVKRVLFARVLGLTCVRERTTGADVHPGD